MPEKQGSEYLSSGDKSAVNKRNRPRKARGGHALLTRSISAYTGKGGLYKEREQLTHASALYREVVQPMPVPVQGSGATYASACRGKGCNHCQCLYREGVQPLPGPVEGRGATTARACRGGKGGGPCRVSSYSVKRLPVKGIELEAASAATSSQCRHDS